jgi:two-component system, NarL family, sensor kinase
VSVRRSGSALTLEVADDGRGMPDAVRPGVGLESMRARAEELDGSFALDAAAGGGTTVSARLPL